MTTRKQVRPTALFALLFSLTTIIASAEGQEFPAQKLTTDTSTAQCSLATLKGTFGFFLNATVVDALPGFPPPPLHVASSGTITYDGKGNLSGESTNNLNGLVTDTGTFTGTYIVNPDCTYSGHHGDVHFAETITGRGTLQETHFVLTDPGMVGYGTDKRVPSGGCSFSTLQGSYALFGQGVITSYAEPTLIAHVGVLTYDGAGNFSGHDTIIQNGATVPDTFTGTYTIDATCTVSAEITSSAVGVLHELGKITGEGESQELHLIVTDSGFVVDESIQKQ